MNNYLKEVELSEEQKALYDLMENTRKNIFITGKAGTGKSYLLKYFKEHTKKNVLYTAPTGIAAINIGAVTIHSAFGGGKDSPNLKDGAKFFKLPYEKIEILRNLEVLIIDEISMVRVDVLEQVNKILQFYNRTNEPFGGKQVIVFGDIFQLPPVVKSDERIGILDKYGNVYFFNSNAYYNGKFEIKELRKIYRQTNRTFIDILNKVREGVLPREYENILNQRYVTKAPDGIVQLVTNNKIREEINKKNLEKINKKEYCYNAEIFYNPNIKYKSKVEPSQYMCDFELKLKVGAHIMMVSNDTKFKRWVNGTFGIVSELGDDYIKVLINGNEYTIEKYEFIKYKCYYNKKEKKLIYIKETIVKQFPVILAYAVTIHKSQGMTYQEVVCDLDGCFAAGQAYVALSRCVSLETLYLVHKVYQKDVFTNSEIMNFYNEQIKTAV